MMSEEEIKELADDILNNGQRVPILMYEGKVLDGRNRIKALELLGCKPSLVEEYKGDSPALDVVISLNLHRRHLNPSQRAMIAARIATQKAGGDRVSAKRHENLSIEDAATIMKVHPRTVGAARKVIRSGDQEKISAIESGHQRIGDQRTNQ